MNKPIVALGLMVCLVGCCGLALAESKQVVEGYTVQMAADYNGDGKVTLEEHMAWAKSAFEQMDLNGDGYIDGAEAAYYQLKQMAAKRAASGEVGDNFDAGSAAIPLVQFSPEIDRDGDGKVSLAEHLAYETKIFKAMANAEGVITATEIVEKHKQAQAEIDRKLRLMREQNRAASQQELKFDFQQ